MVLFETGRLIQTCAPLPSHHAGKISFSHLLSIHLALLTLLRLKLLTASPLSSSPTSHLPVAGCLPLPPSNTTTSLTSSIQLRLPFHFSLHCLTRHRLLSLARSLPGWLQLYFFVPLSLSLSLSLMGKQLKEARLGPPQITHSLPFRPPAAKSVSRSDRLGDLKILFASFFLAVPISLPVNKYWEEPIKNSALGKYVLPLSFFSPCYSYYPTNVLARTFFFLSPKRQSFLAVCFPGSWRVRGLTRRK